MTSPEFSPTRSFKVTPSALLNFGRERRGLVLDIQRSQASADGVVLERHRCPEDRHDPVAGELVNGAAVTLDDTGRSARQELS